MSVAEDDINPYELLNVNVESTEQEIRTAYRQRSLKVHPDRNRNNPDAARKFHELNQAYELLLDPLRRLALDAKIRVKEARKQRFASYDNKRKNLVEELEERERAFKKSRTEKQKEEVDRWKETEIIKEEGRRLREEREKEIQQKEADRLAAYAEREEMEPPSIGSFDTTIRLKYTLLKHPNLSTSASLVELLAPFGEIDSSSIVLSIKPPKKAPNKAAKYVTALVPFKRIGDAFGAVCASGAPERGLDGIEIGWAEGKEPHILGWLKKLGKLGMPLESSSSTKEGVETPSEIPQAQSKVEVHSTAFSSFPLSFSHPSISTEQASSAISGIDYESLTLMRLRQAERDRLAREIREQEKDD